MKRILLIGAVVLAFAPTTAHAGYKIDHARHVAIKRFGVPPCGMPTLMYADPARYAGGIWHDQLLGAWAWADVANCRIVFNNQLPADERFVTPELFCHTYVHEWRHLQGIEHSPDPHSLMYAQPMLWEDTYVDEGIVRAVGYWKGCKSNRVTRTRAHR